MPVVQDTTFEACESSTNDRSTTYTGLSSGNKPPRAVFVAIFRKEMNYCRNQLLDVLSYDEGTQQVGMDLPGPFRRRILGANESS